MPEIFINGQPVQARGRRDRPAGGAAQRLLHPVLLLAPVAVDRRQLPDLRRAARRQELGRDRLQHAGRRRHAGADRLRSRPRAPQGDAAVPHAQPSGRLRHLRQGRRVHAAGLPLRVQRRAVDLDRRQGAARPSTSSCRKRIVLDNERCILCSRCVRFTREISKSNALGIKQRGDESLVRASEDGAFDARRLLRQRRRHLPGRRAAVALVPAQGARLVPEADAVGLPGLRARLHGQPLAPQAGMEAAARSTRSRTSASRA